MSCIKTNKSICVVGGGKWGMNHIRTLNEIGCLGGIVEINNERLNKILSEYSSIEGYSSLEASLKYKYDGYVVATPAKTHYKIGRLLLSENKNVLIEKPLTISTYQAKKLIKLSEKNNCKLMVGHLLMYYPAITKIKDIIDKGKIGDILYIYSTRLNFGTVRTEENVFYSFAPHDISVLNYLIGKSPISVNAEGSCFINSHIYDVVMANFTYPNNIKAHVFVSWLYPYLERKLIIVGSKGVLFYDDSSIDKNLYFYNKRIEKENGLPVKKEEATEIIEYEASAPLKNELKHFISYLDSNITITSGQSGYEVVKILEKVTKIINRKNKR